MAILPVANIWVHIEHHPGFLSGEDCILKAWKQEMATSVLSNVLIETTRSGINAQVRKDHQ